MMILSSGLGLALSLVFGFLLLALLIAEVYYLLWSKKLTLLCNRTKPIRISEDNSNINNNNSQHYSNHTKPSKEIFYLSCCNKPPPLSSHKTTTNTTTNRTNNTLQEIITITNHPAEHTNGHNNSSSSDDIELGLGATKEFLLRALEGSDDGDLEDGLIESELTRLHNLSTNGPPRFLFTIKEETKEDLESEDGGRSKKGSRTRSLSDLQILAVDNPFMMSPLASPPSDRYGGFQNPLYDEAEMMDRLRSSPPPKFKFLRDAEEKLYRRLMEEAEKIKNINSNKIDIGAGDVDRILNDGSFIRIIVGKNHPNNNISNNYHGISHNLHSGSSQVLPLASSPTTSNASSQVLPLASSPTTSSLTS